MKNPTFLSAGRRFGAVLALLVAAPVLQAAPAGPASVPRSMAVQAHLRWVMSAGDNEGAPFGVIDKQGARLWLFDARGQAVGNTPVLLGLARGDVSVPGIGERPMSAIRPAERTTPAGRFIAEPAHNAAGEDIFWVDYGAAVSMHRVRATDPAEHRLQRLATPTPADNRISYGCINVPAAFYDDQIRSQFAQRGGVVYILPETFSRDRLFTPVDDRPGRPLAVRARR